MTRAIALLAVVFAGCGESCATRRDAPRTESDIDARVTIVDAGAPEVATPARLSTWPKGPCPADGTPCRIMPLGDSITDGVGSSGGGYRTPLFRRAIADHGNITFVGRAANGPRDAGAFPRGHEGYSGFTIEPCHGRWGISTLVKDAIALGRPHVILLMIGTNDLGAGCDVPRAPARLGALLDTLVTHAPDALIVVAEITPSDDDAFNRLAGEYNRGVRAEVAARAASGLHVVGVDMYAAFTADPAYKTALLDDGLHPNDRGYEKMAEVWYAAIGGMLK